MNHKSPKSNATRLEVSAGDGEIDIVRATYTLPQRDVDSIEVLRRRFAKENDEILNRSEIIRVGLLALEEMPEAKIRALLKGLTRHKPGPRRKQGK